MLRNHHVRASLIGLATVLALSPSAFAQASWKLYDLRDLISALPPAQEPTRDKSGIVVKGLRPETVFSMLGEKGASKKDIRTAKVVGRNVDDLLNQVCDMMGVGCTRLIAGVYGVEAEEAEHAHLQGMLEELRNLYRERYAVELALIRAPVDQPPAIGTEVETVNPIQRQRFVVSGRTPTQVVVQSHRTFLWGATPVVATGATGYDPEQATITDGLDVSVLVGTDGERQNGTSIEVVGELRKVTWPAVPAQLKLADGGQINLKLPTVHVRSIRSHLQVNYGKPVVLSVLAGFEDGAVLVLVGSIRKL